MINQGQKIAFYTLGCKLNFSETSTIARQMEKNGMQAVDFNDAADVYVINTCSVTDNADKKCRNIVRKALRKNEDAYVVVIGCYAQLKPKEISEIEGVDLVLGAAEKFQLPEILTDLTKQNCGQIKASEIDAANFFMDAYSVGDRTRSFLKIQDGCDYSCSFCTIPLARGKSRSDQPENIIKNANEIAAQGVKEIVLTGVNTGDYGKGIEENIEFFDIVKQMDTVKDIERVRISSIEPNLLKNEIIEFVATSQKFMPHFHIPLQSGSNKILGLMRRRYRRELYVDRVAKIKSLMPHACIGVDVIIGFPGEGEEEFLETYNFLNDLDVSYLHVFTYSERPNTRAVELPHVVSSEERNRRSQMLRILSEKKKRHFYSQFIGATRPVLFEEEKKDGLMYGFTDNYIKVATAYDPQLVGQIENFHLENINEENVIEGKLSSKILVSQ
ncbi:MAG: tRNA (N(6)-L-threonylcarbamoyladenosine(37)-C(2))-methylthiotransferase MtaB [Chitinophagales bacterium]